MARVMQGLAQVPTADAAATLGWLVMAGVDIAVDDVPRNWLAPPPRTAEAPAKQIIEAPRQPNAKPAAKAFSPPMASIEAADFAALHDAVAAFAHPLHRSDFAPQLVIGNAAGGIIILCEQPEPEGSPAAVLRSRMLAAIGLDMDNCALLHRLPWPTTGARTPRADELAAFAPFVARALELAHPRLLLALGQVAAALGGDAMALASARGRWADVIVDGAAVPLLATCQPRLLLTQPLRKRDAWADLQAFAARLTATT